MCHRNARQPDSCGIQKKELEMPLPSRTEMRALQPLRKNEANEEVMMGRMI